MEALSAKTRLAFLTDVAGRTGVIPVLERTGTLRAQVLAAKAPCSRAIVNLIDRMIVSPADLKLLGDIGRTVDVTIPPYSQREVLKDRNQKAIERHAGWLSSKKKHLRAILLGSLANGDLKEPIPMDTIPPLHWGAMAEIENRISGQKKSDLLETITPGRALESVISADPRYLEGVLERLRNASKRPGFRAASKQALSLGIFRESSANPLFKFEVSENDFKPVRLGLSLLAGVFNSEFGRQLFSSTPLIQGVSISINHKGLPRAKTAADHVTCLLKSGEDYRLSASIDPNQAVERFEGRRADECNEKAALLFSRKSVRLSLEIASGSTIFAQGKNGVQVVLERMERAIEFAAQIFVDSLNPLNLSALGVEA